MNRITITVSPTAEQALSLDDDAMYPDIRWITDSKISMTRETANAVLGAAQSRGWDGGWDQPFQWVRPCRAVANRIKAALAKVQQ